MVYVYVWYLLTIQTRLPDLTSIVEVSLFAYFKPVLFETICIKVRVKSKLTEYKINSCYTKFLVACYYCQWLLHKEINISIKRKEN